MVAEPAIELQIRPSKCWSVVGQLADVIQKNASRWFDCFGKSISVFETLDQLPLEMELIRYPERHSGFGSGTQIAFSVARLLFEATGIETAETATIARALNRGQRSAVGSRGFELGGMLVDKGIHKTENLSPLISRTEFPTDWRVVLFTPRNLIGNHGAIESLAFEKITHSVQSHRERLFKLCNEEVIPAIANADYESLGMPLFEFNQQSGQYFGEYQHGCYHSSTCETIVNQVRAFGVTAVGQSSWGPCIFAITKSQDHANELVEFMSQAFPDPAKHSNIGIAITSGNNTGANLQIRSLSRSN